MLNLSELIKNYSLKNSHKLTRLIEPLTQISGIHGFFYYTISAQGLFTFLGTHPVWVEEYYEEHYYLHNPFLCHPSTLHPRIYFPNTARDEHYLEMLNLRRKKIDADHAMLTVNKTHEGVEAFCFYTSTHNPQIYNFYVNERVLLQTFMEYFKQEMTKELLSMQRNPANLLSAKKELFFPKETKNILTSTQRGQFLKAMGKEVEGLLSLKLTSREKDTLFLLKTGKTAQEIAKSLFISKRTIEKYIEHIKFKLQCERRSEIIDRLTELERFGFL